MDFQFLVVIFRMLSLYAMEIRIHYIDPSIVAFINARRRFTIKGVTFVRNDDKLVVASSNGRIVGEIQGLSGISPLKSLIIRSEDPELLEQIKAQVIVALEELVYTIKHINHGPGLHPYGHYQPVIIVNKVTDNSTKNFINKLNFPKIICSDSYKGRREYQ